MGGMNLALELEGVSAGYRNRLVLQDLQLRVSEGERIGILGPNGAGKSTLFKLLSGLLRPVRGHVKVFGHSVAGMTPAERARHIAVVPQEMDIPVAFTVEEIVAMGRTASLGRWGQSGTHDRQAVERAMVYTDVADIRDRPFNELSGGEKQRSIVALALAQEPRILLMDEATSHLDINHRLEIMQLVERLNAEAGVTVLIISHDLQLAAEFSGRLLVLDQGRLVADGPPADVLTEDLLRRVYHCDVRVRQDPVSGALSILPRPRIASPRAGQGLRVHIIGGGGCGEEVMRRLALCGYSLSTGVVNRGDKDAEVASALGADMALEKPFSYLSREALEEARKWVGRAQAVVLAPVPFGPGNLANMDLLDESLNAGIPVFVVEGIESRDFTPGREAVARFHSLVQRGAKLWRDADELLTLLPKSP